jgi:hypothetical protein
MSIAETLRENYNVLKNAVDREETIADAARAFCKEMGIDYTDSYRKAASKILNSEEFDSPLPPGAVVTGGWLKSKEQSIRFKMPQEGFDTIQFREELIEELKSFSPKAPKFKKVNHSDCLLEICMPDFHIGRQAFDNEKQLFEDALWSITERATRNYDIGQIELPIGNDFLNSDNIKYGTTKGTAQFDYQKWYESFRNAWQLLASNISALRDVSPINVRTILGNHDQARMFYVGDVLSAYFHNSDINVVNNINQFHHFVFGDNMVMYDHGEIKAADYPLIMATEFPKEFSKTKYREVHTGHFHKEMVNEYRGIKVRYLPSLAKNSDWEKQKGYKHIHQAQGLVWHKKHGLIDIIQYNVS